MAKRVKDQGIAIRTRANFFEAPLEGITTVTSSGAVPFSTTVRAGPVVALFGMVTEVHGSTKVVVLSAVTG